MQNKEIKTLEDLKQAKANFFGPNSELKKLQSQIRVAKPEDKAKIGQKISKLKMDAEIFFNKKAHEINQKEIENKINSEWIDVTKPIDNIGSLHPLTLVTNRFITWLKQNGYYQVQGSIIEKENFNFDRLNMHKNHPARDMQDSLFINENTLLRTHNTGLSVRQLELNQNKSFSSFAIGPVFRNDEDDATHSHQFMQVDLVKVGYVSFPDLINTLKNLISYVLEEEIKIRTRPSYFPFTEPSIEIDIFYDNKWIEVLGAGILHENVMKQSGYTNDMVAFAAGIGIDRITMIKYKIKDIREIYKNDLQMLKQFKGGC